MKKLKELLAEKENRGEEPRPLGPGEGADDQFFIELMEHYKHHSRHHDDPSVAQDLLGEATRLRREGDVSEDAKLGGAFI